MPWTIIMQEQNNFGVVSLVEAKGVVIDIDKPAKKGKPAETITMKVGANVFIRHDAWKDAPSFDPKNLQGCIKVFYSSQHGSFSVQHPHRLEVNPATNERKMQERPFGRWPRTTSPPPSPPTSWMPSSPPARRKTRMRPNRRLGGRKAPVFYHCSGHDH
jgi:hypothetical protein